jgi:3-phenylpropionate/trans-cinnamate dioxygenase ferredoxin reductase subunit
MEYDVIVVGAGHAAGEFAARLRQDGYAGSIKLIGAEPHLPYQRPPLSKAYLSGQVESDSLLLRPETFFEKHGIGFTGGHTVTRVDRARCKVALDDGSTLIYKNLVFATGGRARRLTCRGADLEGVFYLRTIGDVAQLRPRFVSGARLVIIGGGYIGLEVAAVAAKHGLYVTVLEAAPRVLARVAGTELSAFYEQAHRAAGVSIVTGAMVESIEAKNDDSSAVGFVNLADGRQFAADFVLAGVGLLPNTEVAAEAGLKVDNGIWVNEYCRTEDPAVFAIGDCSNHPSIFLGRRARLESVPNALEQARVAAQNICGKSVQYDAVPWFWSDQYDLKLQAVGLSDGHDKVVTRGAMDTRSFTAFYLREGKVIAADSVNRPADFLIAKRLVASKMMLAPEQLGDERLPLKSFLVEK